MTDVTQILSQIEDGDPSAAELLLPLVYEELKKLAAAKLANEKPGQTLQATAMSLRKELSPSLTSNPTRASKKRSCANGLAFARNNLTRLNRYPNRTRFVKDLSNENTWSSAHRCWFGLLCKCFHGARCVDGADAR